jgi:predicted Ser/Thr protein kinase
MTLGRPNIEVAAPEADPLGPTASPAAECLSTDDLLLLVIGGLSSERRDSALAHLDSCLDCRMLFAGAADALHDAGSAPAPPLQGTLRVGELVANRYRVERFIARGGMGEVYAVHDTVLDERVALKTVRASSPGDVKAIRRLKSEAQLSRRIGHPHTCRIYEFGEHENALGVVMSFFTMQLIEGETLGAKIRRDGALDSESVLSIARQVLGGLGEAHALGILHRDLKSDNIMLRSPPTSNLKVDAVIMDFGLALRLDMEDRLTSESRALMGSAAYMAPEQVEGAQLTVAADLYAFGVILFEMLTSQLPFRSSSLASTALLRLRQAPPAPSSLNSRLEPGWDRVVLGCLQREVSQRFGSAAQVLEALDGVVLGRPKERAAPRLRVLVPVVALAIALLLLWQLRPRMPDETHSGDRAEVPRAEAPPAASAPAQTRQEALLPAAPPAATPPASAPKAPDAVVGRTATPTPIEREPMPPVPRANTSRAKLAKARAAVEPPAPTPLRPAAPPAEEPAAPRAPSPLGPLPIDTEFPSD